MLSNTVEQKNQNTHLWVFATAWGELWFVVFPKPSCPLPFEPQQYTVPLCTAQVWLAPADTELTPVATCCGVLWEVLLPTPSCPLLFRPQQ